MWAASASVTSSRLPKTAAAVFGSSRNASRTPQGRLACLLRHSALQLPAPSAARSTRVSVGTAASTDVSAAQMLLLRLRPHPTAARLSQPNHSATESKRLLAAASDAGDARLPSAAAPAAGADTGDAASPAASAAAAAPTEPSAELMQPLQTSKAILVRRAVVPSSRCCCTSSGLILGSSRRNINLRWSQQEGGAAPSSQLTHKPAASNSAVHRQPEMAGASTPKDRRGTAPRQSGAKRPQRTVAVAPDEIASARQRPMCPLTQALPQVLCTAHARPRVLQMMVLHELAFHESARGMFF